MMNRLRLPSGTILSIITKDLELLGKDWSPVHVQRTVQFHK